MYTIGLDVGTTGTKAYVLDETGTICGQGYKSYTLDFRGSGFVGQNPMDWWDACVFSVRQAIETILDKENIIALSLSTQGGSTFVADKNGNPLMEAMTWMDTRAINEVKQQETDFDKELFYHKTGWKLNESMDAAKYLWLKRNKKELIKNDDCFVSTLEFINKRLIDAYVIDPTNAAMRQLMNIYTLKWDDEILERLEMDRSFLPTIKPSGAPLGTLSKKSAVDLGLNERVQVFNGSHDQYCAAIGAGAIKKGDLLLSTGTAWVLLGINDAPLFTESFIASGPHILHGLYGLMSTLPVAGAALDWCKESFNFASYKQIDNTCKDRRDNAKDLYFYPYFNGITFPLWQKTAKASVVGLSLEHDRFDIARAVMEGVVFQMQLALDNYKQNGFDVSRISVVGGALKSKLWTSLMTNIIKCEIQEVKYADAACIGAAITAGVRCGLYQSYNSILDIMSSLEPLHADLEDMDFYEHKYKEYKKNWFKISAVY